MNYFYLKVFVLICFIIGVSYWTTYYTSLKETFETKNKEPIVLLGDSILKNNSYVSNGKAVDDLLKERNNEKIYSFAENNSKIIDIYSQIDKIPIELNNESTYIFLSAGGNDILSFYLDQQGDITDMNALNPMFSAYKKLVKSIQTRMDKATLFLLDIYYPENMTYKQFHPIITEWNKKIYDYADKNNHNVLKISDDLIQSTDFTMGIEPSSTGGEKIANLILNTPII
jgi:lysophospholipase L1-like esterase